MNIRNGKIYYVSRRGNGRVRVEAVRFPIQPIATLAALALSFAAALTLGLNLG